jgi:ABC-type transporter Mla subunit MlaD
LFSQQGVDRTAFYGTRPYAKLREEFETRLAAIRQDGGTPDPREAQISRLKTGIAELQERLARQGAAITELTEFKALALARLAAQHDEITRLRREVQQAAGVRRLPTPAP